MDSKKKPNGYWNDFSNVERELLTFIEKHGTLGVMPTKPELEKAERSDLSNAIRKHGGYPAVAERLGLQLTYSRKSPGYWEDFSNVENAIRDYIKERGTNGLMPTSKELKQASRSEIIRAIGKHGGFPEVAERLGLTCTTKPPHYWDDFANVEREIRNFIKERGTDGVMPTQTELAKAELSSLSAAINKHGGFAEVARRLGLTCARPERITSRTAADVEKTARAIQPLAESNLLSGAQVMVILRRAGLLEYRNQRVVRLGASLARGNHKEIESAIAQLAICSEELATEAVTFKESEDLTPSEAEALVSSGLESTENPPLAKSTSISTEPDTSARTGSNSWTLRFG